jgi:glycosyltransferase involved in cell wall biosynthesis
MITVSHPTGNQNVRAVLRAYETAGLLDRFFTTAAFRTGGAMAGFLPAAIARELERRAYPEVPWQKIGTAWPREAARLFGDRASCSLLTRSLSRFATIDHVYAATDARVARAIDRGTLRSRCLHAYEDGAAASFAAASRAGWLKVYDLPIGYWRAARRLFEEERELQPDWAATLELLQASPRKLERKDEEVRAADQILVASRFTKATLAEFPGATPPIHVIPYGAPSPSPAGRRTRRPGPLKVLFVGSLGQRKGIAYLFQAMNRIDAEASLTLVGSKPSLRCPALEAGLERFSWIAPVGHGAVLDIMDDHDVLVFPTLFEGFGLVILEAMARGMPVIATPNCAAPEIIADGEDGYIVPIRDPDAIAHRLSILATDREKLAVMSAAARRRAATFRWEAYGDNVAKTVRPLLGMS